jgi:hypothetical protein
LPKPPKRPSEVGPFQSVGAGTLFIEEPPSSRTPALSSLTTVAEASKQAAPRVDHDFLGGTDMASALATPASDLAALTAAAEPEPAPAEEPGETSAERADSGPIAHARSRPILPWLVVIAGAAIAVWWLAFRPTPEAAKTTTTSTEETPRESALREPPAAVEPPTAQTSEPSSEPLPPAAPVAKRPAAPKQPLAREPAAPPVAKQPATKPPDKPAANAPAFDSGAAAAALSAAAGRASACRKEGDPSGTARVTVTFAPSGRVTSANLSGPPFAGTATGGCIASAMRSATVPAFSGDKVTVSKTVVIN